MTRNPILNALAAMLYIVVIASLLYNFGTSSGPNFSVILPIAILALFTISAAVMAYVFFYQPLELYLDGEKNRAVKLFLKTVAVFAGFTVLAFLGAWFD